MSTPDDNRPDIVDDQTPEPTDTDISTAPPQLSKEEIIAEAVKRSQQEIQTWLGRRDKTLFTKLDELSERLPVTGTGTHGNVSDMSQLPDDFDFERPVESVRKIMQQEQSRTAEFEKRHTDALLTHIGKTMDADPMFEDKEFGKQVVENVMTSFGKVRRDVPPDVAARLLVTEAVADITRQTRTGKNPLSKNSPTNIPTGSVSPPATGSPLPPPKTTVKVSDLTKQMAKKWGYTEDDMQRLYGEE